MLNIKSWIIGKLGGVTADFHEETRANYERWAVDHLTGKNGEVTPDSAYYFPFLDDDIVIIRSRVSISNQQITGLKVAPWCKQVIAVGLRVKGVTDNTINIRG